GLPKPALISARLTCDCIQRVFETWAEACGTEFIPIDNPGATELPPRWWELSRHRWKELFESHRLDLTVAQFQILIAALERITKRAFDPAALRTLMEGVNRQEEYFEEVRDLICKAPKTPVRMNEQISNVMAAQWLRGSEWAINHARTFRDEVKARVDQGIAACPSERSRLMWVGAGLWHDTDFYTAFEEKYGAVFVWSMYLAFGPDGYIRYGLDDPLRALASRTVNMNEQLHNPPWANEWVVDQAKNIASTQLSFSHHSEAVRWPRAIVSLNALLSVPEFQFFPYLPTWLTPKLGIRRTCAVVWESLLRSVYRERQSNPSARIRRSG